MLIAILLHLEVNHADAAARWFSIVMGGCGDRLRATSPTPTAQPVLLNDGG
ncbi:MAG: hypothetical protein U0559_00300 [Anaerolineae bacterium]